MYMYCDPNDKYRHVTRTFVPRSIVKHAKLKKRCFQYLIAKKPTYVVGTQKRLNETFFEHPKHMLKLMDNKTYTRLRSKTVYLHV